MQATLQLSRPHLMSEHRASETGRSSPESGPASAHPIALDVIGRDAPHTLESAPPAVFDTSTGIRDAPLASSVPAPPPDIVQVVRDSGPSSSADRESKLGHIAVDMAQPNDVGVPAAHPQAPDASIGTLVDEVGSTSSHTDAAPVVVTRRSLDGLLHADQSMHTP